LTAPSDRRDRFLRIELLRLRAAVEREELMRTAAELHTRLGPSIQSFRVLGGLLDSGPTRGALRWVRRHPLAGALLSAVASRLGGAAAKRLVRGPLLRWGGRLLLVGVLSGVTLLGLKWFKSPKS